jgi:hypothetical protein
MGTANGAARNATGLRCKRLKGNRPLAIREFSLAYDCRRGCYPKVQMNRPLTLGDL